MIWAWQSKAARRSRELLRPPTAIIAAIAFAGAVAIAVWQMRRLKARAQFLVLLALGVTIGFLLMIVVQLPEFPHWLAAAMVLVVFIASPFATRTFLHSLKQDEQDELHESTK
jgi:FtsH-binding integral membrane protein